MSLNSLLSDAKAKLDAGDAAAALQRSIEACNTSEGQKSFLAWTFRAHCALTTEKYDIAEDALVKATDLTAPQPQHQKNLKNLADLYEKLGKWQEHALATMKLYDIVIEKGNFERGCILANAISDSYAKTSHYEAHGVFLTQHLSRCSGQFIDHEMALLERLCGLIKTYRDEKLRENKMSIGRNIAATMEAQLQDDSSWCSLSQAMKFLRFYYPHTTEGFTAVPIISILQLALHGIYTKNIATEPSIVYSALLEMYSLISPSIDVTLVTNLTVILAQVFALLPSQSYAEISSYVDRQLTVAPRPIFLSLQALHLLESGCLTSALQFIPKLEKCWQQLFASIAPATASTEHAPATALTTSQLLLSAAEESVCLWVAVLLGGLVRYDGWTIANALHCTHEAHRRMSLLPYSVRTSFATFLPSCRAAIFVKIGCNDDAEKILESLRAENSSFVLHVYLILENYINMGRYDKALFTITSMSTEMQSNDFICLQKQWCELMVMEAANGYCNRAENTSYVKYAETFAAMLTKENAAVALYRRGVALWLSGGEYRRIHASPCFVNAAKINPSYSDIFMFLGHCYRSSESNTSQRCYLKSLMLNPCNRESGHALTEIYMSMNDVPKAIKLWNDITATCSYAEWSYSLAGKYYMSICEYDTATGMFQKSLELSESADIWYRLAKCFICQLQFVAAHKSLLSAYALDPTDVILVDIGYVEKQLCLLHEALSRFTNVMERNNKDALCYYYAADTLHAMAYQQFTSGWTQGTARSVLQGVEYAEEAVRLGLREFCVFKVLGDLCCLAKFFGPFDYNIAAGSASDSNDYSGVQNLLGKALSAYRNALSLLENGSMDEKQMVFADIEYDMGCVLYYKTQFAMMERGQGTAILPSVYLMTSEDLDRLSVARKHFVKSLEHNPQSSRAWNALGLVSTDITAKKMCYVRATQIDNNPSAYENLCILMMQHGHDTEARECLTALQLIESNPLHWVYVGMLLERSGKSREMIYDAYTAALEIAKPCEALFGSAVSFLSLHGYDSETLQRRSAQDIIDVRYEVEYKLRRVVLLRPMQVQAWILLAHCLILRRAFAEAEKCLTCAIVTLEKCHAYTVTVENKDVQQSAISRIEAVLCEIISSAHVIHSLHPVSESMDVIKSSNITSSLSIDISSVGVSKNSLLDVAGLWSHGQYAASVTCLRNMLTLELLPLVLQFMLENECDAPEFAALKNTLVESITSECINGGQGIYKTLFESSAEASVMMADLLVHTKETDKALLLVNRAIELHGTCARLFLLLCRLDSHCSVDRSMKCVSTCYEELRKGDNGCVQQYSEAVILHTQTSILASNRTKAMTRRHLLSALHMDPTNTALWHANASAIYSDMVLGDFVHNVAQLVEDVPDQPLEVNTGAFSDVENASLCGRILTSLHVNTNTLAIENAASEARKSVIAKQWDDAIESYKVLINSSVSDEMRSQYWLELGHVYAQILMPQSAEACYNSAVADSNETFMQYANILKAIAYFNKGVQSKEYKWIEKAKEIAEVASAGAEGTASAHALKAAMWIQAGKTNKAKSSYGEAIAAWSHIAFPFV